MDERLSRGQHQRDVTAGQQPAYRLVHLAPNWRNKTLFPSDLEDGRLGGVGVFYDWEAPLRWRRPFRARHRHLRPRAGKVGADLNDTEPRFPPPAQHKASHWEKRWRVKRLKVNRSYTSTMVPAHWAPGTSARCPGSPTLRDCGPGTRQNSSSSDQIIEMFHNGVYAPLSAFAVSSCRWACLARFFIRSGRRRFPTDRRCGQIKGRHRVVAWGAAQRLFPIV